MKKFILSLLVLACTLPLSAQESFEGIIKGRMFQTLTEHGALSAPKDYDLYIKGKRVKSVDHFANIETIYDFDKGKRHIVYHDFQTILTESLIEIGLPELSESEGQKEHLGKMCQIHSSAQSKSSSIMGFQLLTKEHTTALLWAEKSIEECISNRLSGGVLYPGIALKYRAYITSDWGKAENEAEEKFLKEAFYAQEIIEQNLEDNLFEAPLDYYSITQDEITKIGKQVTKATKKRLKNMSVLKLPEILEMVENMDAVWLF